MAPKKNSSSQKAATSRKGKEKTNERVQHDMESDPEYFPDDDDLPIFEEPSNIIVQVPTLKKRKGSSGPSLFLHEAAQQRWEEGLGVKKLHLERAFEVDKGPFKKLMHFHKFDKRLTSAPEFCNVSLAREYYAHGKFPNTDGAVYVRGVWVDINSENINEYLGTPSFPSNPFQCPNDENTDKELLNELAHPGAEWVLSDTGSNNHIRHKFLRSDVKLWLKFVLSRLMPSSQSSQVLRMRLYLISAIRNRRPIDVGRIIVDEIGVGIREDRVAIFFPVLIAEMCKAQGVSEEFGGKWKPTTGPIANTLYQKYLRLDKAMEKALAEGNVPYGGEGAPGTDAGNQGFQSFDFTSLHGEIQGLQQSVEHRFQKMDERLECMHGQVNDMYQDWTSHSSNMLARLDDMSTVAQQQFEVLFHRQMVMQLELDRCNKMTVYYHSDSGPPKPIPATTQLAGYQIPNLTQDVVSGVIHEIPSGVQAVSSLHQLPSFGHIPSLPRTPTFVPNPEFAPAARISMIAAGQPVQGFHYVPQPFGPPSFSTTASFSPPCSSVPSSSQGVSPP